MAEKSNRPVNIKDLTEDEKLKYEIAEERGLLDQVMKEGWKSLSAERSRKKRTKSNKNIKNIKKYEHFVITVEKEISICYNRKTGKVNM